MGRYRSLVVLSGFQKRTNDVSHQNQACQFQVSVRTSCVLNDRLADCGTRGKLMAYLFWVDGVKGEGSRILLSHCVPE